MKGLILGSLLCMLSVRNSNAQEYSFPFLTESPSPTSTSMAGTFVALETDDPFAAWYNPAQLA